MVALVGSANMDLRSFRLNFEVHTLVHDGSTAAALRTEFERDAAQSRRVDATSWLARGWGPRVKGRRGEAGVAAALRRAGIPRKGGSAEGRKEGSGDGSRPSVLPPFL